MRSPVETYMPPPVITCGCGSRLSADGQHLCPAITRAEFDALRADVRLLADQALRDPGLDMPPARYAVLRRIAEAKP